MTIAYNLGIANAMFLLLTHNGNTYKLVYFQATYPSKFEVESDHLLPDGWHPLGGNRQGVESP